MLRIYCFLSLITLCYSATPQTGDAHHYTIPDKTPNNLLVISSRIALMYGADATVVETFIQAALDQENQTGISAVIIIAIAIKESSFNSLLFQNSYNPFGIKASKPWQGPTFSKWHDGQETQFRVYSSAEEAVLDLGYFIKSRRWYADALQCPLNDYYCMIEGLKKTKTEPGYSLDPNWDESILNIIEKTKLQTLAINP